MEVNEPEIDTTTQNTSSAKENGQRKRGLGKFVFTNISRSSPLHPEANGNSKKPDEIDIQEAESQWELAKSIRVHTELQQPAVISKITEMEIRDK
ncbi:hypothetical protein JHK85_043996 [Glycine max]|nr:hypothetical protein JHK85_043996 [Glycine max]